MLRANADFIKPYFGSHQNSIDFALHTIFAGRHVDSQASSDRVGIYRKLVRTLILKGIGASKLVGLLSRASKNLVSSFANCGLCADLGLHILSFLDDSLFNTPFQMEQNSNQFKLIKENFVEPSKVVSARLQLASLTGRNLDQVVRFLAKNSRYSDMKLEFHNALVYDCTNVQPEVQNVNRAGVVTVSDSGVNLAAGDRVSSSSTVGESASSVSSDQIRFASEFGSEPAQKRRRFSSGSNA